ncbi:uncharacterized protein CDAR_307841 [Caerostris darwini]|uniref:Uncharacterized protein n=1 Tax=Caerostris darwini TaxID=1538125 RepID=A0AAV4WI69_9ARAC|nr:uncharacterized protein CDAR_307841 [Caerostris darwini]
MYDKQKKNADVILGLTHLWESIITPGFRGRTADHGLGNPAFDDHEYAQRLRSLPEQRPFSVMESVESPPSYEEAVKQELFRFRLPVTIQRTQRSTSLTEISVPREMSPIAAAESFENRPSTSSAALTQQQNEPSTSQGICQNPRKRSSTTGSNGMLSTISEEDSERDETPPMTVVIDCIGIQAARLLENCDTSVNLSNGTELGAQSKC